MKFVIGFSLLLCTDFLNGQTILTPSKKAFERKWLKNASYQMTWYVLKDTSELEIGKVTTNISNLGERLLVVTNINLANTKSAWTDSTLADGKTLKPIMHSSYNGQRDMALAFGKVVTGYYFDKRKEVKTIISDTTFADYFDSNLYPVLIGWLPLKDGFTQDIAIYDYNPSSKIGVLKASVTSVTPQNYNTEKSGLKEVWVVTAQDEIENGNNARVSITSTKKTERSGNRK